MLALRWFLADTTTVAPNLADPLTYLSQLPLVAAVAAILILFVVRPLQKQVDTLSADRKTDQTAATAAVVAKDAEIRRLNDEQKQRDRDLLNQVMPRLQQSVSTLQVASEGLQRTPDDVSAQLRTLVAAVEGLKAAQDGKGP